MSHDIVPPHLAVKAMQDNGYKNAAYAIAELLDNAIEAGASAIELLCLEEFVQMAQRRCARIKQIGVLDNGKGMDAETLRLALQFGNGTHLDYETSKGIGRFGMGLPCSSISQAQRVDVWTWRDGIESAIHSYLDVDEVATGKLKEIPDPCAEKIPKLWTKMGKNFDDHGTLVVWSRLDRCFWRTSKAIIDNSELLIGRIYRKFICSGKLSIRLAAFAVSDIDTPQWETLAQPNDPLYLMENSSCPEPFKSVAMFQQWGETRDFIVSFRGKENKVKVTFSYAKKEARDSDNAGSLKHGKHAARNIGVSVVRAGRELELDESWTIKYDPTERWWGAEIEFPPALDDVFGVTNNKQYARNFAELAKIKMEDLLRGGKTIHDLIQEWEHNGDPRAPLLQIAQAIDANIGILRGMLEKRQKGVRTEKRHDHTLIEEQATSATRQRVEEGHKGVSDQAEHAPTEERIEALAKEIAKEIAEGDKPSEEQRGAAQEMAARIINNGLKYEIENADIETDAFFSVKAVAGVLRVTLNTGHPAYKNLVEVLDKTVENVSAEQLRERLQNASDGLRLLLTAWARYEDEQPDGRRRDAVRDARTDWGRVARQFYNTAVNVT